MWPALRAGLTFFLGMLLCGAIVLAAPHPGTAKAAAPAELAGADTCATCHQQESKGFSENPHARMQGESSPCESCHGAGKAHAEGGDPGKIFNPAKGTAGEVDARCLGCHQDRHAGFERSGHGAANVSCVSCHSVHGKSAAHLLKAAQPEVCFGCHADVKPQFSMAFHHKVEEGAMACSDCHDPHGSSGEKGLKSAAQQDAVCTRCHKEMAGPFRYEHDAIKTEGCTGCHLPHGGANAGLLNRASVNAVCLECHYSAQQSPNPTCTSCHTQVHGSNENVKFLKASQVKQ